MATLEARAEKRLSSVQILFLPMIFLLYGLVLGKGIYKGNDRIIDMSPIQNVF